MADNTLEKVLEDLNVIEKPHFDLAKALFELYNSLQKITIPNNSVFTEEFDKIKKLLAQTESPKAPGQGPPIFEFQNEMETFVKKHRAEIDQVNNDAVSKAMTRVNGLLEAKNSRRQNASLLPWHLLVIGLVFLFNVLAKYDMLPSYLRLLVEGVTLAVGTVAIGGTVVTFLPDN